MPKKTPTSKKVKKIERVIEQEVKKNTFGGTPIPAAPVPVSEPTDVQLQEDTFVTLNYSLSYIRSKPSSDGRVLKIIARGERLKTISAGSNGWTRVETLDEPATIKGYVKSMFLSPLEDKS
jgi:hypothetical protein